MAKSKKRVGKSRRSKKVKSSQKRKSRKRYGGITAQGIIARYLILIAVAFPSLWIFYKIFTPLTALPVYWLLNLLYETFLLSDTILLINWSFPIELIPACIAGSAYYLLLVLNLATPKIKQKIRVYAILFSFVTFLVINILRIFLLSIMAYTGSSFFDAAHQFLWYSVSTLFVVGIWFTEVKLFKIKEIPFYSDLRFLFRMSSFRKKLKKKH